ncbi:MAG: ArsB/NhaD family transporter [Clostridia bacterium]|nr:ArsB/NhaD family transporter [Clostridia bacterium]
MIAQIAAVSIFVVMFGLIITEKIERYIITLIGAALTLIVVFGLCMQSLDAIWNTLNFAAIFRPDFWYAVGQEESSSGGINWATILFLAGMMVMVEGMARVGFFRWLCIRIAKLVHYKTIPLFLTFMIMSAILAMFIDSITVILFLAAVTIELSRLLRFNPVPMVLTEIFCANLGGSATMCGDPPNIIIGTSLGLSFTDFLTNTGAIAGLSLVAVIVYFYFLFRKDLRTEGDPPDPKDYPNPKEAITNKRGFIISTVIFLLAVVLLITHAQTGLTVSFIGVFIALLTLVTAPRHIPEILKRVDYRTLLFFVGLFVVVGGLEQTGILDIVAGFIKDISGGNLMLVITIVIWVSAIASAFVDNIPFAATMIPVITELAGTVGVHINVLAWALSMGTDIGGSATPIGASANVVGTSLAAKAGHPIGWKTYCLKIAPATVLVLIISTLFIFVRYL